MIPNPGRIRIYTSGCPKNQNRCWYRIGSPPPVGSKKEVLKLRSVSSIVIAPASTGNESRSKMAVIRIDHTNRGICSIFIFIFRMFKIVLMKLIAPRMEEIPARWREKMVKSTAVLGIKVLFERGGYTVHPVPGPDSVRDERIIRVIEGGRSQNLMLFIRGNAISGDIIIMGINQFPNPPTMMGITMKKIITKAWVVTIVLNVCSDLGIMDGWDSFSRINILIEDPISPDHSPNLKYMVPMSL